MNYHDMHAESCDKAEFQITKANRKIFLATWFLSHLANLTLNFVFCIPCALSLPIFAPFKVITWLIMAWGEYLRILMRKTKQHEKMFQPESPLICFTSRIAKRSYFYCIGLTSSVSLVCGWEASIRGSSERRNLSNTNLINNQVFELLKRGQTPTPAFFTLVIETIFQIHVNPLSCFGEFHILNLADYFFTDLKKSRSSGSQLEHQSHRTWQ